MNEWARRASVGHQTGRRWGRRSDAPGSSPPIEWRGSSTARPCAAPTAQLVELEVLRIPSALSGSLLLIVDLVPRVAEPRMGEVTLVTLGENCLVAANDDKILDGLFLVLVLPETKLVSLEFLGISGIKTIVELFAHVNDAPAAAMIAVAGAAFSVDEKSVDLALDLLGKLSQTIIKILLI